MKSRVFFFIALYMIAGFILGYGFAIALTFARALL